MDAQQLVVITAIALVIQRVLELRVAASNRARALRRGAREFGAGHYPAFFVLHLGWAVGWITEALLGRSVDRNWPIWLAAFAAAQALRYWAIRSLGERWNTRVLVVAGDQPIRRGPYRVLAHPNYVAVVVELAAVPMVFGAWRTALVASLANAVLLLAVRIPCERRALAWASTPDGRAG